jgi:hypothetical protein
VQRLAVAVVVICALIPGLAFADGLRLGESVSVLQYGIPDKNEHVSLLVLATTARVSRGRAGLSLSVPMVGISGGAVAVQDEAIAVRSGPKSSRFGLADMQVGLDYNLIQNREKMFILTLGGTIQFPTADSSLAIGNGEHLLGLGLSAAYGLTRKLITFADVREGWVGILLPITQRIQTADLGAVYWLTDKFGVTAAIQGNDYAGRAPASVELNIGINVELLPGMMVNLGGIGGLAGSAPQFGLSFGFGFEV